MLCDLEGVTHSLWSSVFSPLIYAGCLKRGLGALPAPKPVTSKLTVFCLTSQALQVILCLEHFSPPLAPNVFQNSAQLTSPGKYF